MSLINKDSKVCFKACEKTVVDGGQCTCHNEMVIALDNWKNPPKPEPMPINCPVCKSDNIEDNSMYADNGVAGIAFHQWKVSDSNCCNDCGVIFKATKGNGL